MCVCVCVRAVTSRGRSTAGKVITCVNVFDSFRSQLINVERITILNPDDDEDDDDAPPMISINQSIDQSIRILYLSLGGNCFSLS